MSFDTTVDPADIPAPNLADKVQKGVAEYTSILRPVSLLVIFLLAYLFVLRPIQKHVLSAVTQTPELALAAGEATERLSSGPARDT